MRRWSVVVGVVLMNACGSGGASDLGSFNVARARLLCRHLVDCGFLDGAYTQQCEDLQLRGSLMPDPNTVSFDSVAAQTCLDVIANALRDCHYATRSVDFMVADACLPVISGRSPEGSSCPYGVECGAGTTCVLAVGTGQSCSTRCEPKPAIGEMCDLACVKGAFCGGSPSICTAQRDEGANCMAGDECRDGLVCVAASGSMANVCSQPVGVDAQCASSSDCGRGLICDRSATPALCVPERKEGEPCSDGSDCAERLLCSSAHACAAPVQRGGNCSTAPCQSPYICVNGACAAPPSIGEACPQQGCLTGYCDTKSGFCEALIPIGKPCDVSISPFQCEGQATCDPPSATCRLCL